MHFSSNTVVAVADTSMDDKRLRAITGRPVPSCSMDVVPAAKVIAASLQAVTLFSIAEDIARLRLEVSVDEADVGAVKVDQGARFTVSAYPNRPYPARITRVAYGSTITDNVVTYLTYLDVDNSDLSLRPGMSATATITQFNGIVRTIKSGPVGRSDAHGRQSG